jgi:hypothetical protein
VIIIRGKLPFTDWADLMSDSRAKHDSEEVYIRETHSLRKTREGGVLSGVGNV